MSEYLGEVDLNYWEEERDGQIRRSLTLRKKVYGDRKNGGTAVEKAVSEIAEKGTLPSLPFMEMFAQIGRTLIGEEKKS